MEKKCIECNNELKGKQKKFCSDKCFGKNRRKNPLYQEQIKRLREKWEKENKERRLAYQREWEKKNRQKRYEKTKRWLAKNPHYHRDYHKREKAIVRERAYRKTDKFKEISKRGKERFDLKYPNYDQEWIKLHPERAKEYYRKYRNSDKGKATWYNRYDRKRRRNMLYLGKKIDWPTTELITMLRNRDKVCFYCKSEFNYLDDESIRYPTFDHINPELPLNEYNSVIACRLCNSSKNDTEVLTWLKSKGYEPSELLLELIRKQKEALSKL